MDSSVKCNSIVIIIIITLLWFSQLPIDWNALKCLHLIIAPQLPQRMFLVHAWSLNSKGHGFALLCSRASKESTNIHLRLWVPSPTPAPPTIAPGSVWEGRQGGGTGLSLFDSLSKHNREHSYFTGAHRIIFESSIGWATKCFHMNNNHACFH